MSGSNLKIVVSMNGVEITVRIFYISQLIHVLLQFSVSQKAKLNQKVGEHLGFVFVVSFLSREGFLMRILFPAVLFLWQVGFGGSQTQRGRLRTGGFQRQAGF